MSLIYKTLFEVKLTHEYYHTASDGQTIFSLINQPDRIRFLEDEFEKGRPSILQDIEFRLPKALEKFYLDQNIKLLPSYSGVKVLTRVRQTTLADNSLVFEPFTLLPQNIYIRIAKKNSAFASYTQSRIKEGLSAGYFLSSDNITSAKTFPFLTSDISPFNSAVSYEQGELASFGAGGIREFFPQTPTPGWTDIKGSTFTNLNDALLLPRKFTYAMDAQDLPDVVLEIKNPAGNTIKSVSATNNNYRKLPIDVSNISDLTDSKDLVFSAALHSIEIRSTTGFFQNRPVLFSDNLFSPDDVGIIHITPSPANNAFNLLASDGFLFKRRNPLGGWSNPPVFEIPFKGRSAFWKYRNDKGKNIQFNPDLNGYLTEENGFLISSRPLAVSKYHSVLHKDGSTDTKYLPNPGEYNLKKDNNGRFCFDILVPDSKLFPV